MLMNLRAVSNQDKTVYYTEDVDVSELFNSKHQIIGIGPVHAELRANVNSGIIVVQGQLNMTARMICSRCLDSVKKKLDIPFYEMFMHKQEFQLTNEREEIHVVSEDSIDLVPYVEETVSLALPFIPLCSEECLGLCPECGINRNEQQCNCSHEQTDPRLAGLADLFQKQ